jgi:hypothetical protein
MVLLIHLTHLEDDEIDHAVNDKSKEEVDKNEVVTFELVCFTN